MSNSLPLVARLRFRLSELLGATALLAVGFAWPVLLLFVLPLIAVVILSRMGFGSVAPLIVTVILSLGLGVVFSMIVWRYPFVQPPLLAELRDISVVEQLSLVGGLNPAPGGLPTIKGIARVPPAITLRRNTPTELVATERILQELDKRKIAIRSSQPISPKLLASIWNTADEAGLLIEGDQGYTDTRTLYGHVGIGRLSDSTKIAFATVQGDQHSNDHYPYYEFVIPLDQDSFTIASSQWFFFDVAGIEGANWLSFAVLSFVVMGPIVVLLRIVWKYCRAHTKRRQTQPSC